MYIINQKMKCELCGKSFSFIANLTKHTNTIHRKKFKCDFCEKSFSYAGALKRHVNAIHRCQTNEKQVKEANENRISTIHPKKFKCNSCGNHFHTLEL